MVELICILQVYGSERFPNGFNLKVESGETMGLVGSSGGGKSTCIQLLLRWHGGEGAWRLSLYEVCIHLYIFGSFQGVTGAACRLSVLLCGDVPRNYFLEQISVDP